MIRFGLCCIFRNEPIKFRRTTAAALRKLPRSDQLLRIADLCRRNAAALLASLQYCRDNGFGGFRVNSQILPLKTHPEVGYRVDELPDHRGIVSAFRACGEFAERNDIRTTFHPDQFIVLSSPDPGVVQRSVAELVYQAEVADWIGADVINIHGGGAYGDKPATLARLTRQIEALPAAVRSRLSLENDDRVYAPLELLPLCSALQIPFVYDIHHHRCLPDGIDEFTTTEKALATWGREPLFHISSPRYGWTHKDLRKHHDYVDIDDFPDHWLGLNITVEVEAKAKELAVSRLMKDTDTRHRKIDDK